MNQFTTADFMTPSQFEHIRMHTCTEMIALKKKRRLQVGPIINITFENRETIWWQIQEMIRIEHLLDVNLIQEEIETYSSLLPNSLMLTATMMLAIDNPVHNLNFRPAMLEKLYHIESMIQLEWEQEIIVATALQYADEPNALRQRTSSVHFLHFLFQSEDQRTSFQKTPEVKLKITHPAYLHEIMLPNYLTESIFD